MSVKRTALALVIAATVGVPAALGIGDVHHEIASAPSVSTLADGTTTTPPTTTPNDTNWG